MNVNSELHPEAGTTGSAGAPANTNGRRRRNRIVGSVAGTALLAAAFFGVTAASAADTPPQPAAAGTASSSASGTAGPTADAAAHTAHHRGATLREELRISLQAKPGFGDKDHVLAYALILRPKAFAKLPANLQSDLRTLEAAPAAERDADAGNIKTTALNGGYGTSIQTHAQAIQAKLASAPAK
ncbi:MAG: hypothetical protein M3021_05605 [Actinomycetota bacterium]|nr:hypothetical protein [Actinomycetota bacterium]